MKGIEVAKEKIRRLAEEFGLKFDPKMFKAAVISKEDYVKLIFILGCPMDPYMKFGKTREERIKKYSVFVRSKEFSEEVKRASGTVVEKEYADLLLEKMDDSVVKKEFGSMFEKIGADDAVPVAVLTEPGNEEEAKFVFGEILFHEWIHVLLSFNNIESEHKPDISASGNLHEGLTSYMQIFLTNENKDFGPQIKAKLEKVKAELEAKGEKLDEYTEDVFDKTLFWNDLLKDKKTPKERRKAIEETL